jgi:hypothetical protein
MAANFSVAMVPSPPRGRGPSPCSWKRRGWPSLARQGTRLLSRSGGALPLLGGGPRHALAGVRSPTTPLAMPEPRRAPAAPLRWRLSPPPPSKGGGDSRRAPGGAATALTARPNALSLDRSIALIMGVGSGIVKSETPRSITPFHDCRKKSAPPTRTERRIQARRLLPARTADPPPTNADPLRSLAILPPPAPLARVDRAFQQTSRHTQKPGWLSVSRFQS